jgi:hypothetical protein
VLAEIKVRSPKEENPLRGRALEDLARVHDGQPVVGISVVSEPRDPDGDIGHRAHATWTVEMTCPWTFRTADGAAGPPRGRGCLLV